MRLYYTVVVFVSIALFLQSATLKGDTVAVHLYLQTTSASMGDNVCLEVGVNNFYDINAGQASINFDPFQLRLDSVVNLNPEIGFGTENFGMNETNEGIFRFNMFRVPQPYNLPDSSVLFSICFKVIGEPGQFAPINFTDFPIPVEFVRDFIEIDHVIGNGGVNIESPSAFEFYLRSCASDSLDSNGLLSWVSYGDPGLYPTGLTYRHLDDPTISGVVFLNSPGELFALEALPPGQLEFNLEGTGVDIKDTVLIRDYGHPFAEFDIRNPSCAGDSDGSITLSSFPEDRFFAGRWSTNILFEESISELPDGTYMHYLTDEGGCLLIDTFELLTTPISINAQITPSECPGDSLGSILVTAEGGTPFNGNVYSYIWETGQSQTTLNALRENLAAGTYRLTVADSNGCFEMLDLEVINEFEITSEIEFLSSVICTGDSTAALEIELGYLGFSGSGGFEVNPLFSIGQFERDSNILSFSHLPAGNYEIHVADTANAGCESNIVFSVSEPDTIPHLVGFSLVGEACPGAENGSITLDINGGEPGAGGSYMVEWSHGEEGAELTSLVEGFYLVTVTDLRGCSFSDSFQVSVGVAPDVTEEVITHVLCYGDETGEIQLQIEEGSNGPVDVAWNTGDFGSTLSNLIAGSYNAEITDSAGCVVLYETEITQPDSIVVESEIMNESGPGEQDGRIALTISGGIEPYDVQWDENIGLEGPVVEFLSSGTYCATVTDGNGCVLEGLCFEVELPSSAGTVSTSEFLNVYPNPFASHIFIVNNSDNLVEVKVRSMEGKLLFFEQGIGSTGILINTGDWPVGTYIISIFDGDKTYAETVIKH